MDNNNSERDDAAVLKKLGLMDGEAIRESSNGTAATHDGQKIETKTTTTKTTTATPTANEHRKEPQENAHERVIRKFRQQGVLLTCADLAVVGVAALAIGRSNLSNFWLVFVIAFVGFVAHQQSKNITHGYISEAQKAMRDEEDANRTNPNFLEPESAEWLNAVIAKLIPIINTDLMLPIMDILEDALKDKFPMLISAVRVEEIDLGVTPFKVRKMVRMDPTVPLADNHKPEEDNSRQVNMEVEFSYDGSERKQASDNIHMIIWIATGIQGITSIELPVFAELSAASGSVKTRMELISDPPFVRNVTLSFPSMPVFTLSARPLRTVNVMRFPLLSDYVRAAVADIISGFIAPNAFTMDVSRLLMGKDVDLNTHNIGLAVIVIHSAEGISNTDSVSKSDPFVVITWAKLGKVLYTTRVIKNELSPQWEEVCFALVPADALREGESLGLTVMDSDRITADDSLGTVDISINDLYEDKGKLRTYEKPLTKATRDANNKGTLKYSVGYFETQDLKSGSLKAPVGTTIKLKVGGAAAPLVDDQASTRRAGNFADRIRETMDAKMPPSPKHPSGILAIKIHQMADLEITRKSVRGSGSGTHTPSTYAQIFMNDEHIFSTRLKRMSSSPYINASTEAFCRDWTRTRVDIMIMDYREREEDAVVGTVSVRLADLLTSSSQMTAWRPILGGIGTGRCRVSVLFKPVNVSLPQSLRGWSIGNVLIDKIVARNISPDFGGAINIRLARSKYRLTTDIVSAKGDGTAEWTYDPPTRIPVLRRYQQALQLRLQSTSHRLLPSNTTGEGMVWLTNMYDDRATTVQVGLYDGSEAKRRRACNDAGILELGELCDAEQAPDEDSSDGPVFLKATKPELVQAGAPVLEVSMHFSRGLAEGHSSLIGDVADPSLQEGLRMREYTIQAGERKAGSARFTNSDRAHKVQRQRWVQQSRQARAPQVYAADAADRPGKDGDVVHLGTLEEEEGGGLAEESQDIVNDKGTHENFGHGDDDGAQDWEDDGAEDMELHEEKSDPTWFKKQKVNLQNDRLAEKGVYQAKIARTGKWLKDASVRKYQRTKRLVRHGEGGTNGPEQEGISSL